MAVKSMKKKEKDVPADKPQTQTAGRERIGNAQYKSNISAVHGPKAQNLREVLNGMAPKNRN
ncbi:hypothetical protein COLO4_18642 [Corchorus olitorius]|uniref:Uncharacterized protein n=1 Tax=Corchorus olitorius TaxID=93759 RepID=A0A1R3J8G0_9ROSI|nr:hypothetical protein COLO4_18642 [Corchorus olitorius]